MADVLTPEKLVWKEKTPAYVEIKVPLISEELPKPSQKTEHPAEPTESENNTVPDVKVDDDHGLKSENQRDDQEPPKSPKLRDIVLRTPLRSATPSGRSNSNKERRARFLGLKEADVHSFTPSDVSPVEGVTRAKSAVDVVRVVHTLRARVKKRKDEEEIAMEKENRQVGSPHQTKQWSPKWIVELYCLTLHKFQRFGTVGGTTMLMRRRKNAKKSQFSFDST